MSFRFALTLLLIGLITPIALGQDEAPKPVLGSLELYKSARDKIAEGKYDLAADLLTQFAAQTTDPAEYLRIEEKYGTTTFLQLRNVVSWSDNSAFNKAAKDTVEKIIAKSVEANATVYRDPARIAKYVNNLIARTREERIYAQQQLRLGGDAVVPVMLKVLRTTSNTQHVAEIMALVSTLNDTTVSAFLAGVEGLNSTLQATLLSAIANRADVLELVGKVETNFVPLLWYFASDPNDSYLRKTSRELLSSLTNGLSTRQQAEVELTRIAFNIFQHKSEFRTEDSLTHKVKIVSWNAAKMDLATDVVSRLRAEEYYALRFLQWSVDRRPGYVPAEDLFIAVAAENAVLRAKFGDLSKTEPEVFNLLASVPSLKLINLLERSLNEKRTALTLGLLEALALRSYKDPSLVEAALKEGKATPVIRALQDPDPRVQFQAAIVILRSPVQVSHSHHAKIVDILRRNLAGETDGGTPGKLGRIIISDPVATRGNKLASAFRDAGYAAERFGTGRELLQQIAKAESHDVIVLDRHVVNPTLTDMLSQLTSDPNAASRPIFLVASSDKLVQVPLEHLLLRLALLVAATENVDAKVPLAEERPSQNKRVEVLTPDNKRVSLSIPEMRDRAINTLYDARTARLNRLITSSDLPLNRELTTRLRLRNEQFTLAALAIEYKVNETSAPSIYQRLHLATEVIKQRTDLEGVAEKITPALTENMVRLIDELEAALSPEQRKFFEFLRERVSPEALALNPEVLRDKELEAQLTKLTRNFKTVYIIPETFYPQTLAQDVVRIGVDPAKLPRDPAERKATAKVAAEWLTRLSLQEVKGYDVKPAAAELIAALRSDDFADLVIDAVARIGSPQAQQDLVTLAIDTKRPLPTRIKAAEAANRNVQQFGKATAKGLSDMAAEAAQAETNPEIKGRLIVLARQISSMPLDVPGVIKAFPVNPTTPGMQEAAPPPAKEDPKEPKDPKEEPKEKDPKEAKEKDPKQAAARKN